MWLLCAHVRLRKVEGEPHARGRHGVNGLGWSGNDISGVTSQRFCDFKLKARRVRVKDRQQGR